MNESVKLNWFEKEFGFLETGELYDILAARAEVFVVEQDCPYQDVDGKDHDSIHLWAKNEVGKVVAYARITPPGVRFPDPSIGRVLTTMEVRGTGTGQELMERAITVCRNRYAGQPIRISAQQYLERFYNGLGFATVHGPYPEDGIPHLEMLWSPGSEQGER